MHLLKLSFVLTSAIAMMYHAYLNVVNAMILNVLVYSFSIKNVITQRYGRLPTRDATTVNK